MNKKNEIKRDIKYLKKQGREGAERLLVTINMQFCGYCHNFYEVDKRYDRPATSTPCKPCRNRLLNLNRTLCENALKSKKLSVEKRKNIQEALTFIKKIEKI